MKDKFVYTDKNVRIPIGRIKKSISYIILNFKDFAEITLKHSYDSIYLPGAHPEWMGDFSVN